jgi:ankyrin repeat protein
VAAKLGRVNVLQVLLESNAQPNAQNRDGLTPLHCAARSGHQKAVEMLLHYGAKADVKTKVFEGIWMIFICLNVNNSINFDFCLEWFDSNSHVCSRRLCGLLKFIDS